ncbi:glycosyltransferase 87 family protein [Actinokineospora auranticolor]|uniref:Alpha-1,2-mannosyltransferase n=1 Tax=Actinokineospora auranticolor TaxID=155976 RepID=A0A2S6GX45_9PSEU|nr:glycosyltransferase 87 family protein [Actinokineospora auranticolor]PPK69789.1 alpha-1,2-mannosyltransferase [Actinokineospora auranticolor]
MTESALRTRPSWVALLFFPVVGLIAGVVGWRLGWHLGVDNAVYRSGAVALLHGEPLYDHMALSAEPSWARLPFTYPPTAALLFVPLALVPTQIAWALLGAVSMLLMTWVIKVCVENLPNRPEWLTPVKTATVLGIVLLGLEPVWRTVFLGQINLVLMAMVVLDVLVVGARGSRFGGVLIGVAAAVKLTPLIFVGHLLVTGRRADAARAFATFLLLQGLMYVLIRHDVTQFWGAAVQDPQRIGPIYWAGNQSLNGLVLRLTDNADWSMRVVAPIALALAVPCVLWVRRLHRAGEPVPALLVTAFLGLLASPVSWSHHWVWAVPLVVYLLSRLPSELPERGRARWVALAPVGAVVLVFASCVLLAMRNGKAVEFEWTPLEYVIGSAYLLVPVVAAAILLVRRRRASR